MRLGPTYRDNDAGVTVIKPKRNLRLWSQTTFRDKYCECLTGGGVLEDCRRSLRDFVPNKKSCREVSYDRGIISAGDRGFST